MAATLAPWELGAFVRARRQANRLSQRELAELAGVGPRFVSELERGKPTLRLATVDAVLAVFGKRLGLVDAPRAPLVLDDDDAAPPRRRQPGGARGLLTVPDDFDEPLDDFDDYA